jgi:NitT/TauT family transport system substrate-binding protein
MAQNSGAITMVDDSKYPQYGSSVLSMRKNFIDQKPDAVKAFLSAIEQAVNDINQKPEEWRPLLGKYKLVPEPMQATFPLPAFPAASIPGEDQFNDAADWAVERGLVSTSPAYAGSVTGDFLPR